MNEAASHDFKAGKLQEALIAATLMVKATPEDIRQRSLLAGLLYLAGELDRADQQFDAIAALDPATVTHTGELRQLVRASICRRDVWNSGRMPELLAEPPAHL